MSDKRKARKDHQCTLCFKTIGAGETYIYRRITPWDHCDNDSFFDYKAHVECDNIWMENALDWDGCLPFDAVEWAEMIGAEEV